MADKVIVFKLKVDSKDAENKIGAFEKRINETEKTFGRLNNTIKDVKSSTSQLFPTFQKMTALFRDLANVFLGDGSFKMLAKDILSVNVNFKVLAATAKAVFSVFSSVGSLILAPFKMAWNFIKDFFSTIKEGFLNGAQWVKEFAIDASQNFLAYEKTLLVVARTASEMFQELANKAGTLPFEEVHKFGRTLLDMSLSLGRFVKGGNLEDLGLQSGIAANKLAEIAGIAGQLGITGESDMLRFISTVAKLAAATDFTETKAAEFLATMQNLFNLDAEGIERLSSAVNELGNTTLATQSQIGEMMRRMAGVADFMGFTAAQTAGLAAAMREVGVTVRVGGTAMSQFMMKILNDGAQMAESLGLNWETLKRTLESNDPMPALRTILDAINNIAQSGGRITVAEKLREMGINGVRLQDTVLKLASNTAILTETLNTSSRAWRENDSVTNEYATVLEAVGQKFNAFKLTLDTVKKIVGEDLAKAFGHFTEKYLQPLVDKFLEWVKSPTVQHFLEEILPKALEWIGEKLTQVAGVFGDFMEDVGNVGVWQALQNLAVKTFEKIKEYISGLWEDISWGTESPIIVFMDKLKAAFEEMKESAIKSFWAISDTILKSMGGVSDFIGKTFGEEAQTAFDDFTKFVGEIPHLIAAVISEIERLMPSVNEIIEGMVEAVNLVKDIKGGIEEFEPDVKGLGTGARGVFDFGKRVLGFKDESEDVQKETEVLKRSLRTFEAASKGAKDVAGSIDNITASTEAADTATKEFGITTVGRSVYPDTTEGVKVTRQAIEGLSSATRAAEMTQNQFGREAAASLNSMATAYENLTQHYNRYSPPTTIANAAPQLSNYSDLFATSDAQTTAQPVSTQTTTTKTSSVIQNVSFNGQNIVDESSKTRFAREISEKIKGLSSTVIRST